MDILQSILLTLALIKYTPQLNRKKEKDISKENLYYRKTFLIYPFCLIKFKFLSINLHIQIYISKYILFLDIHLFLIMPLFLTYIYYFYNYISKLIVYFLSLSSILLIQKIFLQKCL